MAQIPVKSVIRPISEAEWEQHRAQFCHYYIEENLRLSEVVHRMRDNHNVDSTISQWKRQVHKWGIRKHYLPGQRTSERVLDFQGRSIASEPGVEQGEAATTSSKPFEAYDELIPLRQTSIGRTYDVTAASFTPLHSLPIGTIGTDSNAEPHSRPLSPLGEPPSVPDWFQSSSGSVLQHAYPKTSANYGVVMTNVGQIRSVPSSRSVISSATGISLSTPSATDVANKIRSTGRRSQYQYVTGSESIPISQRPDTSADVTLLSDNALDRWLARRPHSNVPTANFPRSEEHRNLQNLVQEAESVLGQPEDDLLGLTSHPITQNIELTRTITLFYTLCKRSIEVASGVLNPTPTPVALPNDSNKAASREKHGQKRKAKADEELDDHENSGNLSLGSKKRKLKDTITGEFPCWWYMRNPVKYSACRNHCSRSRTFHSFRRHHFDHHWKWGDVEKDDVVQEDGIDFMRWKAARHFKFEDANCTPMERDKRKWLGTYRVLHGLRETDEVPDPMCQDPQHVLEPTPKHPIVCGLPTNRSNPRPTRQPAPDLASGSPSQRSNIPATLALAPNTSALERSFLGQMPVFFPDLNAEELVNPMEFQEFIAEWDEHIYTANGLADPNAEVGELLALVQSHASTMQIFLASLLQDPGNVSPANVREVLALVGTFETSFTRTVLSTQSTSLLANVETGLWLDPLAMHGDVNESPQELLNDPFGISITPQFPPLPPLFEGPSSPESQSERKFIENEAKRTPGTPESELQFVDSTSMIDSKHQDLQPPLTLDDTDTVSLSISDQDWKSRYVTWP